MLKVKGTSVFSGVAIGKIQLYKRVELDIHLRKIEDVSGEINRFHEARKQAIVQLEFLYNQALDEVGEENAEIFEVHKMMLDDLDFVEGIEAYISDNKANAENAVYYIANDLADIFINLSNEYMNARAADIIDVSQRVIYILMGVETKQNIIKEPVILLADDLTPSETVSLDKSKIIAIVTVHGSSNSHTAILARTLGIPSLVNAKVDLSEQYNGLEGIVDATSGHFIIEATDEEKALMLKKKEEYDKEIFELQILIGKEDITTQGKEIMLYANAGSISDIDKVLANDAKGIGLFRSEFIYLGRDSYPSEEEQFQIYKEILTKMEGKKVIIRTLDIGADKQVDYFQIDKEENPALGYRAIRICLDRVDIFKTQLRAIYRASKYGNASIMFPMIISVEEIIKIKEIVKEVKRELSSEGVEYNDIELGVMIETPAAVIISDELAKEVDFFSIGTNDLTQYTLAMDRQNQKLESMYDSHHPAVLKMIEMTVQNGHNAGIWVGICGELAADISLTKYFVEIGVDELSVSASYLLRVRKEIRDV